MNVQIHFHGAIDRRGFEQDHIVTCPQGTTVEQVLELLAYPPLQLRAIVAVVKGRRVDRNEPLQDGDTLDLMVPAGGG
ncbi:MAG TPA: MoaD/ThiS family protein [Polyangiaceae bacterium]|jgi:molybdopterin converting factor small subunit|nr:MAG: ThiS family protein [Deltaproteobacteria bacterium ADurb.Bin207]HNS96494.1 MoaD/ThiS family protein [Polyangiaceae bacterium]HNZ24065.1 MoaD/ThiS family protein [Polyangiaceae bacterium]HOD21856.1 MoaD/ThiS family protein [Polyangiaceae bacterium]HOE49922.1 MoaD/ThiS family protein [Polyangiaceae bacterium]